MGYVLPKPSWLLTIASPDRMVTPESVVLLAGLWVLASVLTDCYDLTLAQSPYYGPLRVGGCGVPSARGVRAGTNHRAAHAEIQPRLGSTHLY
ncbi:MAG TPA: hypothetical protein VNM48_19900, partial [Chloroflexota bacterium]|nr:hypothetical protein [Chloroflexota bacterium]